MIQDHDELPSEPTPSKLKRIKMEPDTTKEESKNEATQTFRHPESGELISTHTKE